MSVDIYDMEKRIGYFLKKLSKLEIPEENKRAILEFFDYLTAKGLSRSRILIYANRLVPLAAMFGPLQFKEAKQADIQRIIAEIQKKDWSPVTKGIYRVSIKRFYKWLLGNDEFYPENVRWLKKTAKETSHIMPEELLTADEVQKLIDVCENPRDKCFISMLYESGCRIGEIAGIQIKHIAFDEYGAQVMVDGKTGQRRIRLISSIHYLRYWLELHPMKQNADAPLWIKLTSHKGSPMKYNGFLRIFKILRNRTGITKPTNFHAFRHARATELAKMGLNQFQMEKILGWTHGSDMPQVYLHLSGTDTDNALLKAYGLQPKDDQNNKRKCSRCFVLNEVSGSFCKECGMPLTLNAAVDMENKHQELEKKLGPLMELMKDQEVKEFLANKMRK
ncbi:Tyrosine recombinase XerA [Candidatus Bilamarchaeum dharawalense]|uniref:Tyrosine recombinase XerA n=1 Tax=Candidatus Bilamarchaeum dharawalense TaxID=2885759 RepID=A0A5E4LPY3_9ARCH|nr:Tyrosine recombinase XerA [Candidatus Bilamarchaeum dharawalense]